MTININPNDIKLSILTIINQDRTNHTEKSMKEKEDIRKTIKDKTEEIEEIEETEETEGTEGTEETDTNPNPLEITIRVNIKITIDMVEMSNAMIEETIGTTKIMEERIEEMDINKTEGSLTINQIISQNMIIQKNTPK